MKSLQIIAFFLLLSVSITAQTIDILDEGFKSFLINKGIDKNNDLEIQISEVEQIDSLNIDTGRDINSLEGIEHFTNLKKLIIGTPNIDKVDISNLKKLEYFKSQMWAFTHLIAEELENLKEIHTSFGVSSISINGSRNIERFSTSDNFGIIHDLDYSSLTKLKSLSLHGVLNFSELNLDGCVNLEDLMLSYYPVDIFEILTIKNGRHTNIQIIDQFGSSDLRYVCTDDIEVDYIKSVLEASQIQNVEVNTYCSFENGGELKKIIGRNNIDSDGDGCDQSDPSMPRLKYELTNIATGKSEFRHASDGTYTFSELPGSYKITPHVNNPAYYSIYPGSSDVTITDSESEAYLDFCIEKIGSKNDVTVSIYSLSNPRPGFTSKYWLNYHNIGNNEMSGEIILKFDNNHMKFISSDVEAESLDHGEMIWTFDKLLPNEYKHFEIEFEMNKPTDRAFPLSGEEHLKFDLTVNPDQQDHDPDNNHFSLKQRVVNSYDPNDITMLEGDSISFLETGEFVHYLVRFENTGSADAINIVVKDTIDDDKFDLQSFTPLEGSHPYQTRLTDEGVVEFIFENINLPFESEEKHGHVLFKIKTKKSLVEGDQFSNAAAIYFDYNFPIYTNEFETQVVGVALPVRLSNFDAQQNDSNIDINWTVQSEVNLSHYVVERRHQNENNFRPINNINARNLSRYYLTDNSVFQSGTYYYRLRIVDNDGSSQRSEVITVEFEASVIESVFIYPNPASEYIVIENNATTDKSISVMNSAGQIVLRMKVVGLSKKEISIAKLNKGLHFFSYLEGTNVRVDKVIIR